MRRVVIAAGGTGGHFYPGLVLAKALRERGWQPLILVSPADPVLEILENEGIASAEIDLQGLPRTPGPAMLTFAWKLIRSLRLAGKIIRDFRPDVVVGMGGYLSFPAVLCASWRGVPRAVHESNAVLGLANRLCLTLGAELFRGIPLPGVAGRLTGTPIRPALWDRLPASEARLRLGLDGSRPTLLVFGGSQGARALNRTVPEALAAAARAAPDKLQVIHLSGPKEEGEVRKAYAGAALKAAVLGYLEAMQVAYAAADLVVCRAGASTLAELAAQRKPAVLVPYPSAASAHQEANARVFEEAGAARVVLERDLGARLAALTADLLLSEKGEALRRVMSESYSKLGLPPPAESAARLADAVEIIALRRP